jgi:hypothetical protein
VEPATAILNLNTGVPEIYVRSVEIPTADYGVVGMSHSGAFLDLKFPKWHCPLLFSLVV